MTSWSWIWERGALLVRQYSPAEYSPRETEEQIIIAGFDLDSTLINTKSGKLHATDAEDWEWWHPSIPAKLQELHNRNHHLVIFSNQGRLTTVSGVEAPEAFLFKKKVESILRQVDFPLTIYVACANDIYRKPRIGMWEELCKYIGPSIDRENSYLVGDAAGRDKDHSDSDVHFCENLGIKFFTPEEFFLGDKDQVLGHKFYPKWFLKFGNEGNFTPLSSPEILVFVGLPGAGKTTFYEHVLKPVGYELVSELNVGDFEESSKMAEKLLHDGKSIVIDNINAHIETRKVWLSIASKHGVPCRAFHFTTLPDLCLHNDSFRALTEQNTKEIYPRTPFRKLQASYESPSISEGFAEVVDIEFVWRGPVDKLEMWSKHWL